MVLRNNQFQSGAQFGLFGAIFGSFFQNISGIKMVSVVVLWHVSGRRFSRVARFLLMQFTKTGKNLPIYYKITKWPKIYQIAIKYARWPYSIPNGHKMYQHFRFRGPPKFSQSGIFGLKMYHLATLRFATRRFVAATNRDASKNQILQTVDCFY
jgi:hypothetical protein